MKKRFILFDVLIQDFETKKVYKFTPCEYTVSEMNDELSELEENSIDDILNSNELDTGYIYPYEYIKGIDK